MSDAVIKAAAVTVNAAQVAAVLSGFRAPGRASFQLFGAFSGTITFEATVDGVNFVPVAATPAAGGATVTTATAAGAWSIDTQGFTAVRGRCSTYTSGTPSLSGRWVGA
jgi:hypothetical protein